MSRTNAAAYIRTTVPTVEYRNVGKEVSDSFARAFEAAYQRKRQEALDAVNIASKRQEMALLDRTAPLDIKNSELRLRKAELELGQFEKDLREEDNFYKNGADPYSGAKDNPYFQDVDRYDSIRRPGAASATSDSVRKLPDRTASELTGLDLPEPLQPFEEDFIEIGRENGVDPRALAAISIHETGRGTSNAFRNKNNLMGVSNSKGPIAFQDPTESIRKMARLLGSRTSGPYKNAETLAEIGSIYAPIGAESDPRGLNNHWTSGVSKYLTTLGGDPNAPIRI